MKKVLKGKGFANMQEAKQKTAEALEGIKTDNLKNCFEQWKTILVCVLHQTQSTLKVTEV